MELLQIDEPVSSTKTEIGIAAHLGNKTAVCIRASNRPLIGAYGQRSYQEP